MNAERIRPPDGGQEQMNQPTDGLEQTSGTGRTEESSGCRVEIDKSTLSVKVADNGPTVDVRYYFICERE